MKDRIKHLRKEILGLSLAKFGEKIGLSPQGLVEIEKGRNVLTGRNFDAICKAFNVNPEWLRNGVGEIFIETREAMIQGVVAEFGLTEDDAVLIRTYLDLTPEQRAGVMAYIKKFAANMAAQMGLPPLKDEKPEREKPDSEKTREEMTATFEAEMDARDAARKRGTSTSFPSTGSSGASKKIGIKT